MREIMMIIGDEVASPIIAHGTVWLWHAEPPAKGSWHFMTIDADTSALIRTAAAGRGGGWGSVKVNAQIGQSRWQTSLFPNKRLGGFMLPLKAEVRKREHLSEGDAIEVVLTV